MGPTTGPSEGNRRTERSGAGVSVCIDCDDCALQGTAACGDCLVTFVLGREPTDAVVVDADEARALRMLTRAGLVPGLRHSGIRGDWATGRAADRATG